VDTAELIARLVDDVRPVRRLRTPRRRAIIWLAMAFACAALGLFYFGVRGDLGDASYDLAFWLRLGLLVSTMWLATIASLRLAVPDGESRAWTRWWPLVSLTALLGLVAAEMVFSAVLGHLGSPFRAWMCVRKVAIVGVLPAAASVFLVGRAMPMEPRWSVVLGMTAAGAVGALAAELTCPMTAPEHVLLWHVMPIVAAAGTGWLIGTFWSVRSGPP
jgi:hypothetical protein